MGWGVSVTLFLSDECYFSCRCVVVFVALLFIAVSLVGWMQNILITETGHIKITDFGACRPVTVEAKARVKASSKNLLRQLRDGDWKPNKPSKFFLGEEGNENEEDAGEAEDARIEGTTAYLPPEVIIGGYPTTAADVWALGIVLFQCISGTFFSIL